MKSFQTILLIVFGAFVIGAVLIFSGFIKIGSEDQETLVRQPVTLWGSVSSQIIDNILKKTFEAGDKFDVTYTEISPSEIEAKLIDALAAGKGPDLVILPHTLVLKQRDKLLLLPTTAVSERQFRDAFVESSEILIDATGISALPIYADPIVMYWNRDSFTRAGISSPPTSWLEVQLLPERLVVRDNVGNITEAAVGLGGVGNITHFKDVLATQIMQTGNGIVVPSIALTGGAEPQLAPEVVISSAGGADSALRYFVEFANPNLPKYSWNSAKRNSLDEFIAGYLAMYFGKASDEALISERNPHLNFDVAQIPQVSSTDRRVTYADIYAMAVLNNSSNKQSAFAVAYQMSFGNAAKFFADALGLPPARRDLLSISATSSSQAVFYAASVISKSWYDPYPLLTDGIFADMIEDVMIGKSNAINAINTADGRLRDILNQ